MEIRPKHDIKVIGVELSLSFEEAEELRHVLGLSSGCSETYDALDDFLEKHNANLR